MNTRFMFGALPHLTSERYRDLMKEVRITDEEGLYGIVKTMVKYGFATMVSNRHAFEFKPPVYRFFDLCAEAVKDDLVSQELEVEHE